MIQSIDYVGYKKILLNGEIIETIIISSNPEVFIGEYLPITSDIGEGSLADNIKKLKGGPKK